MKCTWQEGNRITLLENGDNFYPAVFEAISHAQQKVFLETGEKKNVDFYIDPKEFSYYDKNMKIVSCGMKLRISVGNSSDHEWGSSELYI